jgi:C-terminal processing protease CtpA/Prc
LTVVAVLPGTPAAQAGLSTGDQIIELNGVKVIPGAQSREWPSQDDPSFTALKVRRGNVSLNFLVRLLPVRDFLEARWTSGNSRLINASYDKQANCDLVDTADTTGGDLVVGLKTHRDTAGLQVDDVLRDSPAQRAGVRVGDEILAINGKEALKSTASLFLSESSGPLLLSVQSAAARPAFVVHLVPEGLSHYLRRNNANKGERSVATAEGWYKIGSM